MNWLRGEPEGGETPADGVASKPGTAKSDAPPKAEETKSAETKSAESRSAETKSAENKSVDGKAAPPPARVRVARAPTEMELGAAQAMFMDAVDRGLDAFARIEAAVAPLVGMLQATAKTAAKSDQDRKQQFLDLRAHITTEMDQLAEKLREQITREAAIEIWRSVVPALDELDHVLREEKLGEAKGMDSVRMVRRKLRDAFERLGIEEIAVEERQTQFDAHLHEGKPHDGDAGNVGGLAAGTVTRLERTGYTLGDKVLRCAMVTVVRG